MEERDCILAFSDATYTFPHEKQIPKQQSPRRSKSTEVQVLGEDDGKEVRHQTETACPNALLKPCEPRFPKKGRVRKKGANVTKEAEATI